MDNQASHLFSEITWSSVAKNPTTTQNIIIVLRAQTRHDLSLHTRPLPFLTNALFFFIPFHTDLTCPASTLKITILEKEKKIKITHTDNDSWSIENVFVYHLHGDNKTNLPTCRGAAAGLQPGPVPEAPEGGRDRRCPAGGALTKPGAGRSWRQKH